MGSLFTKLRNMLFSRTLELVLVGLANAGKTTFCNFLHTGRYIEEGPTVGLNVKVLQKGGVTTKIWDLGGQAKYRQECSRYARGQEGRNWYDRLSRLKARWNVTHDHSGTRDRSAQ